MAILFLDSFAYYTSDEELANMKKSETEFIAKWGMVCICSTKVLMEHGCQCGKFQEEMRIKEEDCGNS